MILEFSPFFVFVLLLAIVLIFFMFYYFRLKKLQKKYNLVFDLNKNIVSYVFLFISFFILIIGVFDFKWGEKKVTNQLEGLDIVFVLDVSKSMNVFDYSDSSYKYSRLDTAKSMISKYVSKNIEHRFGLIVFAGDAISVSPLTTDQNSFLTFLENVDYRNLATQGSDFVKAIELGLKRFNNEDRSKIMIMISDGGDKDDDINLDSIKGIVKDEDISSFVFGVGTKNGGKIPISQNAFGNIVYQKYKGDFVVSTLNEQNLKNISESLGGEYFKADNLDKVSNYISSLEKTVIDSSKTKLEKIDGTRYLSFIAFVFFILYLITPLFFRKK